MITSKIASQRFILALICLFFLITRLYRITEIPPSVYWDEASIGYNAYSIVQTGKDEWGDFLPIHFRAFGEFKLPVYIYSVVPFVKILGLNEFSVRLPAVLYSLGVVIITYLLAKRLSGDPKLGLFASFFMTLSPWFFIFSRTGYEVTAGLMFYLLGILLFLQHLKNGVFILLATLSFILSAYSYNSFRLIVPITLVILVILELKNLTVNVNQIKVPLILSLGLLLLSLIPVYRLYVYDAGISRLQVVGSSGYADFVKNYLSHFSLDFLIFKGDRNLRSQQERFGQLYLPEIITVILGVIFLIRSKSKYRFLPILLLLISPIPAAITRESPHALRSLSAAPFICMISAMGVASINWIPAFAGMTKRIIGFAVVLIFLGLFANYFINFLIVYPIQSSKEWQYGYKKIFVDYKDDFQKYDRVIISDQYAQPYIFALFYLKYDPDKFRSQVVRNSVDQWGFSTVAKFGKFEFGKVEQLLKNEDGRILIFVSENEVYER